MKPDCVLAKTAKGLSAGQVKARLSARAAALLSAIDGRRDLKTLRRSSGGATAKDIDAAAEELLRDGYVQLLGAPPPLPPEAPADEDPALLMSLDFTGLQATEKVSPAAEAEIVKVNEARRAEGERVTEAEASRAAADAERAAREARAKLEAEVRDKLVKVLRPRVEEALRVKLVAALRPKIEDELRTSLAAALRPRLEAEVRAQLETALTPRIELELRTRFARQIADMKAQVNGREQEQDTAVAAPVVPSETAPHDHGAARLLACLSDSAFATDVLGVLTEVNAAWTQLSGRGEGESKGKALADFFAGDERSGVEAFLGRIAQGTAIRFVHEALLERGDGDTVWVEVRAAPLTLASGEAAGVCGVLREATEARRAAAELEDTSLRLLLLVDESDAGVLMEDAEGAILQVNPAFCALFSVQAAPFSFEGGLAAELIQQIALAFADVDELLTCMARIRAAAEDVDGFEIALSRGGPARLSYRAVAEDGPARGHLWIFRLPSAPRTAQNPV